MTVCSARPAGAGEDSPSGSPAAPHPTSSLSPRYHALDCVRATAMLLGVFYHWQFVGGGFGMAGGPKGSIDHWLHSFRMPLFFLISGFFANMMLGKYGVGKYLARRWWRIGMPLLVAILAFAGLRFGQEYIPAMAPPNPFAAPAAPWGGGTFGQGGAPFGGAAAPGGPGMPGFAPAASFSPPGQGGLPGPRPGPGIPMNPGVISPGGVPPGRMPPSPTGPGAAPFNWPPTATTGPAPAPPMPMFGFGGAPSPAADALLKLTPDFHRADGRIVRFQPAHFMLQHLWFLWYLLVFVTVAPVVTVLCAKLFVRGDRGMLDDAGRWLVRWNVAPVVLGLLAVPLLMHARGPDWTLMNPGGFSGVFPDVAIQYFRDMPYYFFYFLGGWFLFRLRDRLPSLAGPWLWNLVLGIAAFAISQALYTRYAPPPAFSFFNFLAPAAPGSSAPAEPAAVRLAAFALYAVGAALSGFGLVGLFQKHFNRPTRLGQYFTDTMLWVYLVQLPLIPYLGSWVDFNNTSWWEATLGGMVLVTAVSLVLFELIIRPTPLVHIFGPASLGRRQKASPAGGGH